MNNILLIEDDMSINKILAYELRKKGYLVDSLYDGKEAVSKILENDYDLVLIDWMLPYKDGVSIIKEVRQNDYVKPLILLTARSEQEDIIKLQKLELKEYSVIVGDMQNRIVSYNTINNNLNKQIEQYKKRNKILIGTSCGVIAVAALILIIK